MLCIFVSANEKWEAHLHTLYVSVHQLNSPLLLHHCSCNLLDEILSLDKTVEITRNVKDWEEEYATCYFTEI